MKLPKFCSLSFWLSKIWLTVFVSSIAGHTHAQQPTSGTLVGTNDGDILHFECEPALSDRAKCKFVQVLLTKDSDNEGFEEQAQMMLEEFKEENDGSISFCSRMSSFYLVAMGEKVPSSDEETKMLDFLNKSKVYPDQQQYDDNIAVLESINRLCIDKDIEAAKSATKAMNWVSSRTCKPFVNSYEQTFVRVDEKLWVVEASPSGDCGVINTSRFIADEEYGSLWSYVASKVVTNPTSTKGLIACNQLDERAQPYNWDAFPHFKNCVYLD